MEKHNSLLLKVSRLFPSSFNYSCQSRALTDVARSSIITITKSKKIPQLQIAPRPENVHSDDDDAEGRKCPPVSPVSTTADNKQKNLPETVKNQSSSSNSGQLFTSSDEKTRAAADGFETDTFYSLSSNSGDSFRPKTTTRRRLAARRCEEMKSIDETSRCSFSSCGAGSDHASTRTYYGEGSWRRRRSSVRRRSGGVIEEGLAVERRSSDPHSDFMASMVEMIVEKQMFGAEDLDRLLSCFLSLNETEYHGIIFHVFSEICQTMFCT